MCSRAGSWFCALIMNVNASLQLLIKKMLSASLYLEDDMVKTAILHVYELVPEALRQIDRP